MKLKTAIRQIYDTLPQMEPGDRWMVLSKDHGMHCTVTNEESAERLGYRNKDVMFVYQHSSMESAELVFEGRI